MYDSFGFNKSNHKFPLGIMIAIITIVNDINCGLLTQLSAESKILAMINDSTDTVVIRLLLCIKSMVETLPMVNQKRKKKKKKKSKSLNFVPGSYKLPYKNYLITMTMN